MFCSSQNSKCQDLPKFQFQGEGVCCRSQNSKCQDQDLPKFQFGGEGCSVVVKTQSAKICLNFNFQWGGGGSVVVKTQSGKICLNFNFQGEGVFCSSQNSKCQDLPKFQLGGCSVVVKTQSAKICLNFNFRRGGVFCTKFQNRDILENLVKNFWKPSLPLHHK